jgi:hypothetical protein
MNEWKPEWQGDNARCWRYSADEILVDRQWRSKGDIVTVGQNSQNEPNSARQKIRNLKHHYILTITKAIPQYTIQKVFRKKLLETRGEKRRVQIRTRKNVSSHHVNRERSQSISDRTSTLWQWWDWRMSFEQCKSFD